MKPERERVTKKTVTIEIGMGNPARIVTVDKNESGYIKFSYIDTQNPQTVELFGFISDDRRKELIKLLSRPP